MSEVVREGGDCDAEAFFVGEEGGECGVAVDALEVDLRFSCRTSMRLKACEKL
jgi:hypothetical protein